MLGGQVKGISIAGGEQRGLAAAFLSVNGTHGMDHVLRGQPVTGGNFCLAGAASAQGSALLKQARSGVAMNRAIHSAAAQQSVVSGVHNSVHPPPGDVIAQDFDLRHN